MPNKENIIPHQFKKGKSGNPIGRIIGSKNRSTIAKIWLNIERSGKNPITGVEQMLSQEDIITLSLIRKASQGDVSAYRALMDSAYGTALQSIEIKEKEKPIFKQLDISVNKNNSTDEDS
tara:strand:+ start:1293 stop:1652 length:360 start_codon:yes stop_codon:yes gene_type:complete